MTEATPHPAIPRPDERAALNAALMTTGAETGFYDEHGRPASWPDDIEQWTPVTNSPVDRKPDEQPF